MIKVIAIGDVHGQWPELWRVLKAAAACTPTLEPTQPVIEGRYQVVCVGDLVHYKDIRDYAHAVGEEPFDPENADHLRRAAKAQIRELYRFKRYVDQAAGNVTIILGNHDESALDHKYELSTRVGLKHVEFDESKGGVAIPDDLRAWFAAMPRERVFHGVQFAPCRSVARHAGLRRFLLSRSRYQAVVQQAPVGDAGRSPVRVYGHTVMKDGIYLDRENSFAMIDALGQLQFWSCSSTRTGWITASCNSRVLVAPGPVARASSRR